MFRMYIYLMSKQPKTCLRRKTKIKKNPRVIVEAWSDKLYCKIWFGVEHDGEGRETADDRPRVPESFPPPGPDSTAQPTHSLHNLIIPSSRYLYALLLRTPSS
jgi:hypothetical protein